MKYHRRQLLGLSINGPYSRNRRRSRRLLIPIITTAIILATTIISLALK